MENENPIGLAELIANVKAELLSTEGTGDGVPPLFSVDEVILELQVTVHREGKAGVRVWVVEAGGGLARDAVQKVSVTLTPLLSKPDRVDIYKDRHPKEWRALEDLSSATLKGSQSGLGDTFDTE